MAKDPYKYFRVEAQEILDALTQGALQLEQGEGSTELVNRMLRHAHTLKGAARIVGQAGISQISHQVEELLAPYRDDPQPLPPERASALLRHVDEIAERVGALAAAPAGTAPAPAAESAPAALRPEEALDTVRVEIAEMDRLLRAAAQAGVQVADLRRQSTLLKEAVVVSEQLLRQFDTARLAGAAAADIRSVAGDLSRNLRRVGQDLADKLERAERELAYVHELASGLRLLPASTVFAALARAARDAADSAGKSVEFISAGGGHRLDGHVLAALREALLHIVRNAVAHGIELPEQRLEAGKPPRGRIELRVERRGDRIAFICRDDGQGIDLDRIRRMAVERGMIAADAARSLGVEEAMGVLLRGGLSTSASVTELAGRGVGMRIVREAVAGLKGEVRGRSEAGHGTEIELVVPVSLESLAVLEVEAGQGVLSVPFSAVRTVLRVRDAELVRSTEGDAVLFDGQAVAFAPLTRVLGGSGAPAGRTDVWSAVVIAADESLAAVSVDRVLHRRRVVVRPLPAALGRVELVLGASFDAEGNPQPVLDPAGLAAAVHRRHGPSVVPAAPSRPVVLVIDDSLTTRMLEQNILETAGYNVDVAVSGEVALEKAGERPYALFVVDVEMPGMSGFEFIEKVRANRELKKTPAILVTSRSSPADRLRGEKAGAQAYIVKSEFDEGRFLETVRRLIG